jgi:hypothetical protein
VLVRVFPPVAVVGVPVDFGEESEGGCGVSRRHLSVVVLLLGHERGQAGGVVVVVQAECRAGRRRRGDTTAALVVVIGVSSETTKDAVWHSGGCEAEMPHQSDVGEGKGRSRWRTHGTGVQGCWVLERRSATRQKKY